ncbi:MULTISPECIES: murein hydrolase activator EnvC family protein [Flavobacteriaceae]|uniref:Peptidase M23 n=2 Tax=Flavobacteriaceae TaxID=49546 RepID=A0A4Y8ATJ8_9FLAO|nr:MULTISPECIES: peptidoglycan DD-metalloendopeptidase family protein [Flavobacteriaceae]TEW74002.1 peptidase M23 [Gramella jeungdoensis]GGK39509.1 peptidase M23 [Lutibacter litoralis]
MQFKLKYLLLFLIVLISVNSTAQKSKRQVLEARRVQLQKDQIYINALLSNTIRTEKNVLNQLKDLDDKINTREDLINAIENESNELGNEIYLNQLEINKNKRALEALKKDYGEMIYSSYKSKSQNSRIMFLLSSKNFFQGYKRFQYMKQYTAFRKKQGDEIHIKTSELQTLTDSLQVKKDQKKKLLDVQRKQQSDIEKEKKEQEVLLSKVKQKENKYKKQIKQFQREESRVAAQIDKLIRAAIVASNKKSGNTSRTASTTFALTPEAKELASKFELNKGKLDWPVEKGFVSTFYGKQPHPIVKSTTIQSNGVRITTNDGSKARAIFNGTVLAVQVMGGNKKMVYIQHGNYITVYKNLENVFVNTGDKVTTKQEIGTIFKDKITGKTILSFVLTNNAQTLNPATWIYRM